jgi:iron complex outermembrane recepter protein
VIQTSQWGQAKGVTTAGFQVQDWAFEDINTYGQEQGHQYNRARFIKTDWQFPTATQVTLGWRSEGVRKTSTNGYDRRDRLFARELGISQALQPGWNLYGRVAQSYRLPNIDENRATPSSLPLLPQFNRDREVGLKWAQGEHSAAWRWFSQKTRNEIALDPSTYKNVNIAPARRRGVELEGRWQATRQLNISGTWQALQARYAQGPDAGRDMVLVAPHTATLRLNYQLDSRQSVDVGVQRMSALRFDNDKNNTCANRIPASTMVDARYAVNWQTWDMALSVTNLTDRDTYSMAFSCTTGSLYPEAGRAVRLSVTRRF